MIFQPSEVNQLKSKLVGKNIVFTNGCFDIVHRGHIDYLNKSKSLGDVLVVGLNTDRSVRDLKGENRPINNELDRAFLLDNLKAVDFVILFDEETPYDLIKQIQPHILVKGKDYIDKVVIGQDIVENNGGHVELIDFITGYSSTNIINKIVQLESTK